MVPPSPASRPGDRLAAAIEHTLLRPDAGVAEVRRHCEEALRHRFAGVCVAPSWLPLAARTLAGSGVLAVTVAGFPLGFSTTEAKAFETGQAASAGADEIDVVAHLGHLRAGAWSAFRADLAAVVAAAGGRPVKAILETGLFPPDRIARAAKEAVRAGARFVKTSTGFGPGGASVDVVRALRAAVGARAGVKASGGIRTREAALALLDAGADRLGTSASLALVVGPPG